MPYLSTEEVAKKFGCSSENVFYYVKKGLLEPHKGKSRMFEVNSVIALSEMRKQKALDKKKRVFGETEEV